LLAINKKNTINRENIVNKANRINNKDIACSLLKIIIIEKD